MNSVHWVAVGLGLIAAAALTSPPYQITPILGNQVVARSNVWTGRVDLCIPDPDAHRFECHAKPNSEDQWSVESEAEGE
jgi:hypothetical protein